jgi:hypothetical protein
MSYDFTASKKSLGKYEQKYFARPNSFPSPVTPACYYMTPLVGLPESSGGRIRIFSCRYNSMVFHACISLGNEQ